MTSEAEAKLQAIRESQQRASKKQREKRKAMGYKLLGVEFSPEGLVALEIVKPAHGSVSAAVNAALIEAARRAQLKEGHALAEKAGDKRGYTLDPRIEEMMDALADQTRTQPVSTPKPTKTAEKPVRAVREAAEPVVGAKLDIPFGPPPRKPGDLAKKGTRK